MLRWTRNPNISRDTPRSTEGCLEVSLGKPTTLLAEEHPAVWAGVRNPGNTGLRHHVDVRVSRWRNGRAEPNYEAKGSAPESVDSSGVNIHATSGTE